MASRDSVAADTYSIAEECMRCAIYPSRFGHIVKLVDETHAVYLRFYKSSRFETIDVKEMIATVFRDGKVSWGRISAILGFLRASSEDKSFEAKQNYAKLFAEYMCDYHLDWMVDNGGWINGMLALGGEPGTTGVTNHLCVSKNTIVTAISIASLVAVVYKFLAY